MPRGAIWTACVLLLARVAVADSQPDTAAGAGASRGSGLALKTRLNLPAQDASDVSVGRRLQDERQQLLAEVGITSEMQSEMTERELSDVATKVKIALRRMEADERLRGGDIVFDKRSQKVMIRVKRGAKHAKRLREDDIKGRHASRTGQHQKNPQSLTINDSPETLTFARLCAKTGASEITCRNATPPLALRPRRVFWYWTLAEDTAIEGCSFEQVRLVSFLDTYAGPPLSVDWRSEAHPVLTRHLALWSWAWLFTSTMALEHY